MCGKVLAAKNLMTNKTDFKSNNGYKGHQIIRENNREHQI